MGLIVWGAGLRGEGLGYSKQGVGFRGWVWGSGGGIKGLGFRGQLGFKILVFLGGWGLAQRLSSVGRLWSTGNMVEGDSAG